MNAPTWKLVLLGLLAAVGGCEPKPKAAAAGSAPPQPDATALLKVGSLTGANTAATFTLGVAGTTAFAAGATLSASTLVFCRSNAYTFTRPSSVSGGRWCSQADFFEPLAATLDLGEDAFGPRGPHECAAVLVRGGDESHDFLYQIRHALETSPAHRLVGQLGEPALHEVEPA